MVERMGMKPQLLHGAHEAHLSGNFYFRVHNPQTGQFEPSQTTPLGIEHESGYFPNNIYDAAGREVGGLTVNIKHHNPDNGPSTLQDVKFNVAGLRVHTHIDTLPADDTPVTIIDSPKLGVGLTITHKS